MKPLRAFAVGALLFLSGCAGLADLVHPGPTQADISAPCDGTDHGPDHEALCKMQARGGKIDPTADDPSAAEAMCKKLGGKPDVEGKLVGSVVTGGRMHRCFDPNDPEFLARKAAEKQAREDAARQREAESKKQAEAERAHFAALAAQQASEEKEAADAAAYADSPEGRAAAVAAERQRKADAEADERGRAAGARIVRDFKRCMVAAAATREAARLRLYETSLFCEYIQSAANRCHSAAKCDSLSNPDDCVYDGGVGGVWASCP